jgi:hypothetical protein
MLPSSRRNTTLPLSGVRLALALAVCATVACCGSGSVPPSRYPDLTCQPGSFSAPDDQGALTTIPRQGANATVLEFWARWCTGCKASVLRAVARREAMASSGIELVLVGVLAQDDSIADARAVLASWGVDSPFIVDRKGTILRKYGISDMPAAVVLDRNGAIQWVSPEEDAGIGAAEAAAERARRAPCGG